VRPSWHVSPEFQRCFPRWSFARQDIVAHQGLGEPEIELWRDSVGLLTLSRPDSAGGNVLRLRFDNQIAIDVRLDEQALVEFATSSDLPQSTRDHFLVDQVIPRMLAHEGRLVLHAGAVEVDQQALLMLGQSGSGKSTLTTSFDRAGHALLGDDALVISWDEDRPRARTVYPSLRLLPDSIAEFFPDAETSDVAHYTWKQRIALDVGQKVVDPLPIRAIVVIGEPAADDQVRISALTVAATCMALIENSFMLDPTDMQRVRQRLDLASDLAGKVPGFAISYPRDYGRLPEVRDAMLASLRGS